MVVDHTANTAKQMSNDRILVLKLKQGQQMLSSKGAPDKRLFNGENRLHAVRDSQTSLWGLRYDSGILPEPLKQSFTTFQKLIDFVSAYYIRRNIEISEVLENFDG